MAIDIKKLRKKMRTDDGINGDAQRLEELVWLLFLKLFDSKEKEWQLSAEIKGKEYDPIIPSEYRWYNWAEDPAGITGDELLEFIDNPKTGLLNQLKNLKGDTSKHNIVRSVFNKDTHNYMKSGTILRQTINIINETDFNASKDRHEFNDIYEKMLKELQSAGSSGEFYTPRPVTEFVVEMVNPKINERVLDFACGTGGFLTCTLEHYEKTNQIKNTGDMQIVSKNVRGIEKKQLPHALCMTNLILHGIETPSIERRNSLAGQVSGFADRDQVDVIVTNPPYGGIEEDGIETSFAKEFQTKETADLFMALLMEKLSDNGRCGIVLPDSILFGDGVKNNLKSKLLKEFNLHTIVRLPEGVFAPYTSITTNLLFFNRDNLGTKEIWYYELALPEGMERFTKSNQISINDFEQVKKWWNNRQENENAWLVKIEDIKNYNLDIKNPNKVEDEDNSTIEDILNEMEKLTQENLEIVNKLKELLTLDE